MKIQNRIYKTELIEWQKVKDLQPDNLKIPYNLNYIKDTVKKFGVSKAYDVCEIKGQIYWLDGHTRTQIFYELINEGVEIPDKLTANFCKVKDKKEAIAILLEVHNQKLNPIDGEVLNVWVKEEEVEVDLLGVNIMIEEVEEDVEHKENIKEITNIIAVALTEEEQEIWLNTKEQLGKLKDKNAIFELIKQYTNETNSKK
jgi:hypothetical protein